MCIIRRMYDYKSKENVLRLYTSLLRPHLDNCVQALRPYKTSDMNNIESIQRRALRLIQDFREIPYEDRLRRTNLMSLETRRLRADLIEVFNLIHGYDDVDSGIFFIMRPGRLDTQRSW